MDFFEHQEKARRKSGVLVFYFILAVLGIVASICTVVAVATGGDAADPAVLGLIAAGVVGVILLGSGFKTLQLNGGGSVVAKDLGGRRLSTDSRDFHEKRLLNVVEEMAIASGVPVPEVYVMDDEDSVNAFAAGKSTSDAVIGVTRGCMKLLSRDELQGVVAHEFSHILNGDMKLNMRLIGLLFGILFIAMIGRIMLRGAMHSGRSRSKDAGKAALAMMLIGVAIMLVGYIGLFFGKLIKAAVSRQREYLADASAVQFTRNPDGIGGALMKIGGLSHGSRIQNPKAEEASHMFFGNAMKSLSSALATHPPLPDRIQRILPHWNGKFPPVSLPEISAGEEAVREEEERHRRPPIPIPGFPDIGGSGAILGLTQAEAIESMSGVHPEQIEYGRKIRREFPENWVEAAHSESGAQALVFALLLAQDDDLRGEELSQLRGATDEHTYVATVKLHREIAELHSAAKLALVDLAIPSLRRLSPDEYERFRGVIDHLMASDKQINLFEFTLQKVIRRHLDNFFGQADSQKIRHRKIAALKDDAAVLITTLAQLGNPDDSDAAQAAFILGATEIEKEIDRGGLQPMPAEACGLREIDTALDRFAQGTPLMKKRLLHACGKTVMADNQVTSDEAELIRAVADAIGCPIPPFVKTGTAAVPRRPR